MTKDRKTGVNVVRRIRSFVFGKKKGMDRNNNCNIPSLADTTIKYTPQKNNRQHQDDIQQQQQQRQDDEQQQQQHAQNEKEKKNDRHNDMHIPFLLFLKCFKKALSSKKGRQQLFWDTYSYFWHLLFEDAAVEGRMAKKEEFDFDSDFDDEFY